MMKINNLMWYDGMGLLAGKVREIIKISQESVSLETPIGEEEDSHLGDLCNPRTKVPGYIAEVG